MAPKRSRGLSLRSRHPKPSSGRPSDFPKLPEMPIPLSVPYQIYETRVKPPRMGDRKYGLQYGGIVSVSFSLSA